MKIGLQTWGSEGDIRPLLALGHGLSRRGHEVELLYTDFEDRQFGAVAEQLGFRATAVATPVVSDEAEMTEISDLIARARDPLSQGQIIVNRLFNPVSAPIYEASIALCQRADIVVGHFFLYQLQVAAAMARRPHATVMFAHNLVPSRWQTPTGLPHLGLWANKAEWALACFALNRAMLPEINRFRASVGVASLGDVMTEAWVSPQLNLIAVSPTICQAPPDWPSPHRVSGFLALTSSHHEAVPDNVLAFLQDGPPPVFMGFGSLMPRDRRKLDDTVSILRAAALGANVRAIIHVPPGAHLAPGRDGDVLVIGRLSHAAVFPRCAAIVHHGGAGTTQTALAAGVPSIVVPHIADQFFWADELQRIGVASRPLRRRALTANALADRIRLTMGNRALAERAKAIAPKVRAENGVERASELIEQLAESAR